MSRHNVRILCKLLIETCEFPNNTSPKEWLARRGN
jgi:hypothetical protein